MLRFVSFMKPFLKNLKIDLNDTQISKFETLGNSMLADPLYPSVSKIFEPKDIAQKHFLDCLAPLKFNLPCWSGAETIIDLGTGGGFPALPLAIMFPESNILAVDSRLKSVEFVARMAEAAGLKNVSVKHSRIEELAREKQYREQADLVVCRALSAVRTLLEYTLPLVKTGGYTLYYKGPKLDEEIKDARKALEIFQVERAQTAFYRLEEPQLPFSRGYLLIKKQHPVSDLYPRKNGLPSSRPL
ncbi:MAG: 16S rRNA (guanine(527)-N(7))-methyltransferase RsmG [Candidatus Rifleibacteriota bacterium]